ncbi:MAG: ABC transporter permease [Gemmataceae bacterium]
MSYALATLWFDRQRYLPGILAVAFSALLMELQFGLLLGLFSVTSIPIDRSHADIWVGAPKVLSVDVGGQTISENKISARVASEPGVVRVESYIQRYGNWEKPGGGTDLCIIIGTQLGDDALGAVDKLTPDLRDRLSEADTVVVDRAELARLDILDAPELLAEGRAPTAKINGRTVRVVGLTTGMKSIAGPYIFCSLYTARNLLKMSYDQCVYVLARCDSPQVARDVVARLKDEYVREDGDMSAFTAAEFSLHSRMHWLTKTGAGIALGYAAFLGLLVGAVVTSQTLYAATMASMREYAILLALGIPRWRLAWTVVTQAWWIGMLGVCIALPAVFALAELASYVGVTPQLPWQLLAGASVITLVMAIGAGTFALRSLRQIEPVNLLR